MLMDILYTQIIMEMRTSFFVCPFGMHAYAEKREAQLSSTNKFVDDAKKKNNDMLGKRGATRKIYD